MVQSIFLPFPLSVYPWREDPHQREDPTSEINKCIVMGHRQLYREQRAVRLARSETEHPFEQVEGHRPRA